MIKVELEIKLNKLSPVLAFSVIILSSILALGINLGFAGMPWENVAAPINVSGEEQAKQGELDVNEIGQKDWLTKTNATWRLGDSSSWFKGLNTDTTLRGNDIYAYNQLWTEGDLMVSERIYAPNQDWADTKTAYRNTADSDATTVYCDNGWYLISVYYHTSGNVEGICGSPFMKEESPVGGGGGGDVDAARDAMEAGFENTDWLWSGGSDWWFMPGAW